MSCGNVGQSLTLPGVSSSTSGRPWPSVSMCSLVVNPPRERPIAWWSGSAQTLRADPATETRSDTARRSLRAPRGDPATARPDAGSGRAAAARATSTSGRRPPAYAHQDLVRADPDDPPDTL